MHETRGGGQSCHLDLVADLAVDPARPSFLEVSLSILGGITERTSDPLDYRITQDNRKKDSMYLGMIPIMR